MSLCRLLLTLALLALLAWLAWEVRRLAGEVRALREGLGAWRTW